MDVIKHAKQIMFMFKTYKQNAGNNAWAYVTERQMLRDCLQSMVNCHLIKDYNLHDCSITLIDNEIIYI